MLLAPLGGLGRDRRGAFGGGGGGGGRGALFLGAANFLPKKPFNEKLPPVLRGGLGAVVLEALLRALCFVDGVAAAEDLDFLGMLSSREKAASPGRFWPLFLLDMMMIMIMNSDK